MTSQMHDWEYIAAIEESMKIIESGRMYGEAPPSAADSIFTEALLYTSNTDLHKFKQRLNMGLDGRLEFAGLYAGIAAKYAYFCTLGKHQGVLYHFGTQSWQPAHTDLVVSRQPSDAESLSEGLGYARQAWAIMLEEPRLVTYGARRPQEIIILLVAILWRSDSLDNGTLLLQHLRQIRHHRFLKAASAFVCQLIGEACSCGKLLVISLQCLLVEGLVVGATAQSTALAILDSSNGFDLAAVYSLAKLHPSTDAASAGQLVTLLCERASAQDVVPAALYVYRDMAVPQHVLQRLAAVLASVPDVPSCLGGSNLEDSARSPANPLPSLLCGLIAAACFNASRSSDQRHAVHVLPVQLLRHMQTLQHNIDADRYTWQQLWCLYAAEDLRPDSEDMLYEAFQIWANHMLTMEKSQRQASFLPTSQQLAIVCRLLSKRGEYAQALRLADLVPNMPVQQVAKHASIVFESARAAECRLDTDVLRIIMARCVLGGTSALLRCCNQAFEQLAVHTSGTVSAQDALVMAECHLRARNHVSALQMLQLHSSSAATAMPPHKQDELFNIALESRRLHKSSPQLVLELLGMSLQWKTSYAKSQASNLITDCLQGGNMQLASQVLAMCDKVHVRLAGEVYAQYLKTQLRISNGTGGLDDVLHTLKRLRKAGGKEWSLLLDARNLFALCAVLNKHMHHALVLQTVQPWLSRQVVTKQIWTEAIHAAAASQDKASLLALWEWRAQKQYDWNAPNGAAQVMSAHVLATSDPKQGVQMLMHYQEQGYAEALTTDQCNVFLQLCVADMTDKGIYPEAVKSTTMLLTHMADMQQPAPDMTSFSLVLGSVLLSLDPQREDLAEQSTKVLLSLYSSFLPLLHSQFSTSADTCVVYTQMMAAFRRIHDVPAAFQVFLLMFQNKVESLTPECYEEVLEVLLADRSNNLWDYAVQHFGERFVEVELLEADQGALVQLPLHRSFPNLTMWTSPDGSVQRLSVGNGPTPYWMLPAWQGSQPDYAAAHMPYSSKDASTINHAAEANNGQGDELHSNSASVDLQVLSADHGAALQELVALPKSKVKQIAAGYGLKGKGSKESKDDLIEQIMKTRSK